MFTTPTQYTNMTTSLSPSYSILNKLTPDNFERLCYELTHHISFPNKEILKGAILLVRNQHETCFITHCMMWSVVPMVA